MHNHYTLVERKTRLYAVLAEIIIGGGEEFAVTYPGMVLFGDRIGYIIGEIFRRDRCTLHDLIAGTSVIKLHEAQKTKSFFDFSKL